jgi:AcrR family transcriptional regulator
MEEAMTNLNGTQQLSKARPARLCASDRRQILLDAAIATFGEKGYYATTMEEIAVAAGVTKPVIYQHFESKRDLYSAILKRINEDLVKTLKMSDEAYITKEERFTKGFEAYFRFVYENRAAFELMFSSRPRKDPEFREIVNQIDSHVASSISMEIDTSLDKDHRDLIATGVIALAEGMAKRYLREHVPELDSNGEEIPFEDSIALMWARRMSSLIWNGLQSLQGQ